MTVIRASISKNVTTGMTDDELELSCEHQFTGISSWAYWTSELYSFGKCLRFWTKYPDFLPLFIYADHGVGLLSHLLKNDLENTAEVHFTWHPMKEKRYKFFSGKKVLRIIHPWISYRRKQSITRTKKHKGTLVFYSHSTCAVHWEGHDTEKYFDILRGLPDKFQPVVLCLHMHDINAGLHKKLRSHGFPIVTAGNTSSINFVDRFYDLVKSYSYATSQTWGSQVAYCVEIGIPYFFLGERPKQINMADKNFPIGVLPQYWDNHHEEYSRKTDALFSTPVDRVTDEQREFIESLLGVDSKITPEQIYRILWVEFFKNWTRWHLMIKPSVIWLIRKLGLFDIIKKTVKPNVKDIK